MRVPRLSASKRWCIMRLRFRELILLSDEGSVELLMSLILAMWGGYLLMPGDTFASMTTYRVLAAAGVDERLVGAVVFALGADRIYHLLNHHYQPGRAQSIVVGGFWGFNLFLTASANPTSLLVPIYASFLITCFWIAVRIHGVPRA